MHGDRQGWMMVRSDAAVRPTESERVQPCIAKAAMGMKAWERVAEEKNHDARTGRYDTHNGETPGSA